MPSDFSFRSETKELTPEIRANLPGEFFELPDGVVHYELGGQVDGPIVVLVHGFSVPYFIWDPTFKALCDAGFWVLRYDLYGRGYSDRPEVTYNVDLYDKQLIDLLNALGFKEHINPVGLSMGGVLAANFADRHPERVSKLALFDPAGFPLGFSLALKVLLLPGIGELLFNQIKDQNLENSIARYIYEPRHIREFIDQYSPQMQYRGFRQALLSTLRSGFMEKGKDTYKRIGESELPVLLVWGEEDKTVPFRHSKKFLKMIPQIEFHPIKESGHIPHYEKAEEVNPILIEFLSRS
jgi:pimeloyl-ACP methyl ester carboxylesterase